MLETHLPDERKAIAERRAALEAELVMLADYDATLERIEHAMRVSSRPTVFSLNRRTGTGGELGRGWGRRGTREVGTSKRAEGCGKRAER
jgi:hypothetical protein